MPVSSWQVALVRVGVDSVLPDYWWRMQWRHSAFRRLVLRRDQTTRGLQTQDTWGEDGCIIKGKKQKGDDDVYERKAKIFLCTLFFVFAEISGLLLAMEGRTARKDTRTIFEIGRAIEREKRLVNQGETSGSLGNPREECRRWTVMMP